MIKVCLILKSLLILTTFSISFNQTNGSESEQQAAEKDAPAKATVKGDPKKWVVVLLLAIAAWWLKRICQRPLAQDSGEVQEGQEWIGSIDPKGV